MANHLADNWLDIPLIADYQTSDYLNNANYEAIVLNDDHLYMWNIPPDDITLTDKLRQTREIRHPFWVDRHAIAHVIPQENVIYQFNEQPLKAVMNTLHTDDDFGRAFMMPVRHYTAMDGLRADHHGHTINVLSVNHLPALRPRSLYKRWLLIDQYEQFTATDEPMNAQLTFRFTGAPVVGLLSEEKEQLFWQHLARQSETASSTTQPNYDRQCAHVWHYFVTNSDYLTIHHENIDIRTIELHLTDCLDTLVWRNLMAMLLENEHVATQASDITPEQPTLILLIRLRYDASHARQRWNKHQMNALGNHADHLKRNALSAAKLHFKRFAAFFMRVLQKKQQIGHAPLLYWTVKEDERSIIRLIYQEILRETMLAHVYHLTHWDRFLKIEPLLNTPSVHHDKPIRWLISPFPLLAPTHQQQCENNILGVFQNRLINHRLFSADVYALLPIGLYIAKHRGGAPIYKLHTSEI